MEAELQLCDVLTAVSPLLTSAVPTAALHWFTGAQQQQHIVLYARGTGVPGGVPAAPMIVTAALGRQYGHVFWAVLLIANALVSGATVGVAYWIDAQHHALTLDDVAEARHAASRD